MTGFWEGEQRYFMWVIGYLYSYLYVCTTCTRISSIDLEGAHRKPMRVLKPERFGAVETSASADASTMAWEPEHGGAEAGLHSEPCTVGWRGACGGSGHTR